MAETIWEFLNKEIKPNRSFYGIVEDTLICVKSENGQLAEHHIFKNFKSAPKDAEQVNLSPTFDLAPTEFDSSKISPSKIHKKHSFEKGISLRSYSDTGDHFIPFLLQKYAKESDKNHIVYAYLNSHKLTLVFYSNKSCQLSNAYDITDPKELVYFFTSLANQHGLGMADIWFKVYSSLEAEFINSIVKDYIPNFELVEPKLPYEPHEMPPYATETYLLLKLGECALPEEI